MSIRIFSYLLAAIAITLTGCGSGGADFTDNDIDSIKSQIRNEFENRPGVNVLNVSLIKESPRKLTGFVKLNVNGYDDLKSCTATMSQDTNYLWQCN